MCMRSMISFLVFVVCGTQSFHAVVTPTTTTKQHRNRLTGSSFSPKRFAISLKSYNSAFSSSEFCVDGDDDTNMPIGYVRELCDQCESCLWEKRGGFTSEVEWETAVLAEMSRLGGNNTENSPKMEEIVGTWIAEAPLSLRMSDATMDALASKLGVSMENTPVVPETQDRLYYLVSGTPSEVQGLVAAGFSTITPLPPRLKVDPVLEAAAAGNKVLLGGGRDHQDDTGSFFSGQRGSSAAHLLSSAWSGMISSRLGHEKAKVMAEGGQHVTVQGLQSSAELYQVALEIAHHGAVKWVAPQNRIMPSNYFARQLVESGTWYAPEEAWGGEVPAAYNPLSAIGLTGKGEVVGIADTGLDWNSCFFKDPKVTPKFKWTEEKRALRRAKGYYETWSSSKHRKIRQYVAYMNGEEDENDGHGTHISGSVAGSCLEQDVVNRDYAGVAPNAKIAFFDVYSKTEPDFLGVPSYMGRMLDTASESGAHVYIASFNEDIMRTSNGWESAHTYSAMAKSIDRHCYHRQTFVVLASAGNAPHPGSRSRRRSGQSSTISRPAESKSVVTVGSHFNPDKEYGAAPSDVGRVLSVAPHSAQGPTHDGRIKPDVCGPGSGVYSAASTVTPLTSHDRTRLAASAAADTSIPTTSAEVVPPPPEAADPVIVSESENCRGVVKYGTSSANAIVGGVTVLVRQYFTKGYYPDGKKKLLKFGFTPMGALLKAVLVNSARPLTLTGRDHFNSDSNGRQPDLPNNKMGWGGVNIASTLVTPESPRGLQLKVFGKSGNECEFFCPHVSQNQVKVYNIQVLPETYGLPLKVTLVWFDKPTESGSRKTLVSDLDLTVTENGATARDNIYYFANGNSEFDRTNTVEHIQVPAPTPGAKYTIKVTGSLVPQFHQYYALVISGPFDAKKTKQKKETADRAIFDRSTRTRPAGTIVIPPELPPAPSAKVDRRG